MNYLAMPEQWRAIPGLEGFYDASTHGRIRSIDRVISTRRGPRRCTGRVLKPGQLKDGRLVVSVCIDGKMTSYRVSVLVARTFLPAGQQGEQVCHGPAGLEDNNPGNLYYGTAKRNSQDRKRDGTWMGGERSGVAKLTWVLIGDIRERYQAGESQWSLARRFGVSRSAIAHVISGRNWTDMAPLGADARLRPRENPWLPGKPGGAVKLTRAIADEIRRQYRAGRRQADLARDFGISQPAVSYIVRNKTWTRPPD
jgi:hypothetical protein